MKYTTEFGIIWSFFVAFALFFLNFRLFSNWQPEVSSHSLDIFSSKEKYTSKLKSCTSWNIRKDMIAWVLLNHILDL